MAAFTETRQGSGFPDWEIVRDQYRWFDWYNQETVTELQFDWEIGTVPGDRRVAVLAVCDRTRRVIRSGFLGAPDRVVPVPLYLVSGLVRRDYGRGSLGHTEYFVAGS